jgi:hypothetical protein
MGGLQGAQDVLSGAAAGIDVTVGLEFFESSLIVCSPFALRIWPKWTAHIGSFVPAQAKPPQVCEHRIDEFRFTTGAIQIFVAHHEYASLRARALLCNPEGAGVAEVEETGRRRGEAAAIC